MLFSKTTCQRLKVFYFSSVLGPFQDGKECFQIAVKFGRMLVQCPVPAEGTTHLDRNHGGVIKQYATFAKHGWKILKLSLFFQIIQSFVRLWQEFTRNRHKKKISNGQVGRVFQWLCPGYSVSIEHFQSDLIFIKSCVEGCHSPVSGFNFREWNNFNVISVGCCTDWWFQVNILHLHQLEKTKPILFAYNAPRCIKWHNLWALWVNLEYFSAQTVMIAWRQIPLR